MVAGGWPLDLPLALLVVDRVQKERDQLRLRAGHGHVRGLWWQPGVRIIVDRGRDGGGVGLG